MKFACENGENTMKFGDIENPEKYKMLFIYIGEIFS